MANSDSRFLIVIQAREKLASKTGELSRSARSATNRILKLVSELGEQRAVVTAREAFLETTSRFSQAVWSAADGALRFRSRMYIWGARAEARIRAAEETGKFQRFARSVPERILKAMPWLRAARLIVRARRRTRESIGKFSRGAMSISRHISTTRDSMGPRLAVFETRRRVMAWLSVFSRPAQLTSYRVLKARERLRERRAIVEARKRVVSRRGNLLLLGDSVANKVLEGESRLANWGPNTRSSLLLNRAASNLQSLKGRLTEAYGGQKLWAAVGVVIVIVVAARLVTSALANSSRELPVGSGGRDRSRAVQDAPLVDSSQGPFGFPETPQPPGIVLPFELLLVAPTPDPASDFEGAQVLGVTHLSATSSMMMMHIKAPSDSERVYKAVLTTSEDLDFQCLTLEGYANRLYCVGPRLQEGTLIGVRIFRVDEDTGSQVLIFETEYHFLEAEVPVIPTPFVPTTYGAGFTWPDRFDQAKVQREEQSSEMLWPLSGLFAFVPMAYRILARRDQMQRSRLVNTPEFDPVH